MTRVILVRHGETEWNREERFRGRIDVDLNANGRAQADACARHVAARFKPAAVYTSPLTRALHTAEAIATRCGLPVKKLEALADLDFGQWHGLTLVEASERWPDLAEAWRRTPSRAELPGGEALRDVQKRAEAALLYLRGLHAQQTIVAVAHDVVNRALILAALGGHLDAIHRVGQDTAAVNVLDVGERTMAAVCVNDTCHLR